jgi:hypothetical protein
MGGGALTATDDLIKLSSCHHVGDKGERKYGSLFLTSAVDGGEWSES